MSDESSDASTSVVVHGVRCNNEDGLLSTAANHEVAQKRQRLVRGGSDESS